ncbi:unnamed protein product [Triticum turgidum subsp. durum]|uniref:SIAH-type domain-containing protein n=1 Tax=Triticum turgidum subsp. durum TaxID=4567 RepID=A0A9R0VE84_TRITD|nr:unnamed protein product [Triticum turgidum subsp. durum]
MDGGTTSKRRVGAPGEGESSGKRQNATMGMDALDCPVCFHPLRPPIYQECPSAPCFCPASSCSFAGPTDALLEHSASQHKWPCTTINYSEDVELCLEPGLHFLRTKDREIFLLNVALEPYGHAISVVCIQPKAINSKFKCRMSYGSFLTNYYQRSVYKIRSSSLSDGLPKGYNLILPKDEIADDGKGTLLTFSIDDPNPKVKVREPICLKPTPERPNCYLVVT